MVETPSLLFPAVKLGEKVAFLNNAKEGFFQTNWTPILIPQLEKPKRRRKADGDPMNVRFESAKGDITFTAKSRKKKEVEEGQPAQAEPAQVPQAQTAQEAPGLYELMHEHLNTRANRRMSAWQEFKIF